MHDLLSALAITLDTKMTINYQSTATISPIKPAAAAPIDNAVSPNTAETVPTDLAKQMQDASLQASKLLKSLSHPDRLLLLCQLTQGEYCVGELEILVGVGQPSLSQQLGILRKDALVATRRDGKQIYYRIASDDALAVLQLLYQRFCAKTH